MLLDQYSYILAIRQSGRFPYSNIQDFFDSDELGPFYFDSDEIYYDQTFNSKKTIGQYQLLEPEKMKDFLQADWPLDSDCPFVEGVMGYCLLEPWHMDSFWHLVKQVLLFGCGFLVCTNNGVFFDITSLKKMSLNEVVNRHGFKEGTLLLMETSEYDDYIRSSVSEVLSPLGLKPSSYHAGDHGHILDGFEGDDKNYISNWEVFDANKNDIFLNLWIADWEGFDDFKKRYS